MADPERPKPVESDPGMGLRGPSGCGEWTVVILGIVWAILMVVFILALALR